MAFLHQEISNFLRQKSASEIFSRKDFEKLAFFATKAAKKRTLRAISPLEKKIS